MYIVYAINNKLSTVYVYVKIKFKLISHAHLKQNV